jgi:hypothetical protein
MMPWIKANPEKTLLAAVLLVAAAWLGYRAATFSAEADAGTGPSSGAAPKLAPNGATNLVGDLSVAPRWDAPGTMHRLFFSRRIEWRPQEQKLKIYALETEGDDGIARAWKKKHGFPENAKVGPLDTDNDGFTNKEEYDAGKDEFNPRDPESHPDYLAKLRLASFEAKPFRVMLRSYQDVGGRREIKIDLRDVATTNKAGRVVRPTSSVTVATGERLMVGDFDTGWVAGEFTEKREKRTSATGMEKEVDESFLQLANTVTGQKAVLTYRVEVNAADARARLVFLKDNREIPVSVGREFEFDKRKFKVKSLSADGAVIAPGPAGAAEFRVVPTGSSPGISTPAAAAPPAATPPAPAVPAGTPPVEPPLPR